MIHMPDTEKLICYSQPPSAGERVFVVLVLLISAGAFTNLEVTGSVIRTHNMEMPEMQAVWALIYFITMVLYFRNCGQSLRNLFKEWPLIAVIALALSSILWSQDPAFTLRRAVALALTFLFGTYFGSRFSLTEQLRLLALTCWVCIAFSFIFELLALNLSQVFAGWNGIFYIKSHLGRIMALGALVFLFWRRAEPSYKGLATAGFLASLILLALSQSMTSVVELVLLLILLPCLQRMARKDTWRMVGELTLLFAAGIASFVWMVAHLEYVTAFLGRSASLTGRVPLWIISIAMALRRPWLGYGYDAFWMPDQADTIRIWRVLTWEPPHAHNGFLELWLELGLVGLTLFLVVFTHYVLRSIKFYRNSSEPAAIWPLMLLAFLFFANFTDTCFIDRNSIFFILYAAAATTTYGERSKVRVAHKFVQPRQSYA
jgi:exopolysaccharide production protein ExoQ